MFKKKNKYLFILYVILSSLILPDMIYNFMNDFYWKGIQLLLIMVLMQEIWDIYGKQGVS